jgi:hypothetical protein
MARSEVRQGVHSPKPDLAQSAGKARAYGLFERRWNRNWNNCVIAMLAAALAIQINSSHALASTDYTLAGSDLSIDSDVVSRSISPSFAVAGADDLQLNVNTQTGDVTLVNYAATSTAFTAYNINVIDSSSNVLLVGNPADGNGTGINQSTQDPTPPNTEGQTGPFTQEMFLTAPSGDPNYNSSAAALGNNPARWSIFLDGYNGHATAFGLSEAPSGTQADAITLPVSGSIDLGHIFVTLASQTDLQFTWQPTTAEGGNQGSGGTTYAGLVDYMNGSTAPEPGTLGCFGLGGVMLLRRRRLAATIKQRDSGPRRMLSKTWILE